jgi:hypothetical protein
MSSIESQGHVTRDEVWRNVTFHLWLPASAKVAAVADT